jgi:hypothetical protein
MTIPSWSTVFVNNVMSIPAAFLNYLRTYLPRAVDGVGGGIITPSTAIEIQGTAGLKLNGTGDAKRFQYGVETIPRTQRSLLFNNDTGAVKFQKISIGTPVEQGIQYLVMPDDSTLKTVTAYHNRNDTGTLPGTRVQLSVWKTDITTGTVTQIGTTVTDPTSVLADYNAHHGFSVTGLSEVIDNEKCTYYALFNGEAAPNETYTEWYGCTTTVDVTSQDKAQ